jgi:hypothetical protein
MLIAGSRTFVYGKFMVVEVAKARLRSSQPPEVAIELLREFSSSEFIGKLYGRVTGSWSPFTPQEIENYDWYRNFREGHELLFDLQGGTFWRVTEFRTESDETGSYYIAVALTHLDTARKGRYGASRSIANYSNELVSAPAASGKKG